jgi:Saxitoxin biosynthesis operon protein SxtJ
MIGEINSPSTDIRDIRKFGFIATIFFGTLFSVAIWRARFGLTLFFGFLFLAGLGLFLFPSSLSPVYHLWMKIAHAIGRTVTIITLSLTYYLVITPMAILKRIFGGSPIALRPDPERQTYWVERSEPAQPKERFLKRY